MAAQIRVGALVSGGGTNLQAILDACAAGALPAEVVFVGSDNPQAHGLERARSRAIPVFTVDYGLILKALRRDPGAHPLPPDFVLEEVRAKQTLFPPSADPERVDAYLSGRAIAEGRLLAAMRPYPFDLLVLAGFMRNLTPYFIDRVNTDRARPRIMNIHPALLPAFPGMDGYGDTFRYGCKVAGCTVPFRRLRRGLGTDHRSARLPDRSGGHPRGRSPQGAGAGVGALPRVHSAVRPGAPQDRAHGARPARREALRADRGAGAAGASRIGGSWPPGLKRLNPHRYDRAPRYRTR